MASKEDVEIKIIGTGSSKFGLWLLGFIARRFHISLEVRPTKRAGGRGCTCGAKKAPAFMKVPHLKDCPAYAPRR